MRHYARGNVIAEACALRWHKRESYRFHPDNSDNSHHTRFHKYLNKYFVLLYYQEIEVDFYVIHNTGDLLCIDKFLKC